MTADATSVPPILGHLAAKYPDREISDVQIRTGEFIRLHTNRGLEIAESFGIPDATAVRQIAEALFEKQSAELWAEPGSNGDASAKMWEILREKRVMDLSCEEGVLGAPVRMRV